MPEPLVVGPGDSLGEALGVGRDLVSFVGAGGKTTLLHRLGAERHRTGDRVILTTTTKMGTDQERGMAVAGPDPAAIAQALDRDRICLVVAEAIGTKLVGVAPTVVDGWWDQGLAELVAVEADGARRNLIKAPAEHEPVIPASSTVVVWVMSALAFGEPIADVAHRPDLFAAALGVSEDHAITPELVARLVTSSGGGRKGVPAGARLLVAVTRVGADRTAATALAEFIRPIPLVMVGPAEAATEMR